MFMSMRQHRSLINSPFSLLHPHPESASVKPLNSNTSIGGTFPPAPHSGCHILSHCHIYCHGGWARTGFGFQWSRIGAPAATHNQPRDLEQVTSAFQVLICLSIEQEQPPYIYIYICIYKDFHSKQDSSWASWVVLVVKNLMRFDPWVSTIL